MNLQQDLYSVKESERKICFLLEMSGFAMVQT